MNGCVERSAINRYRFPKQVVLEALISIKHFKNGRVQFAVAVRNSFEVRQRDENILSRIAKFYFNFVSQKSKILL